MTRVQCPNCGGDHPKWDCKRPAKKSTGLAMLDQPGRGSSPRHNQEPEAGSIPAPVDTNSTEVASSPLSGPFAGTGCGEDRQPKFDKKAWMREYMRDHRKGIRRRKKALAEGRE